jgi:uncharacterized repeat protein (TIGR01451 family)
LLEDRRLLSLQQVNPSQNTSAAPVVTIDGSNNFVVAWLDFAGQEEVFTQRYSPSLAKLPSPTPIPVTESGVIFSEQNLDVAGDSAGDYVVAYPFGQAGAAATLIGAQAQRFSAHGVPQFAQPVSLVMPRPGTSGGNDAVFTATAMNASGAFILAAEDDSNSFSPGAGFQSADHSEVQEFSSAGVPLGNGPITLTNTTSTGPAGPAAEPAVAMDDSGDFVALWNASGKLVFQLFNSSGTPLSTQKTVVYGSTSGFSVAMNATTGSFVIVWADNAGVHGQLFDSTGNLVHTIIPLIATNVSFGGSQPFSSNTDPVVSMDPAGNFVVVYNDSTGTTFQNGYRVFAQRFSAAGVSQGYYNSSGVLQSANQPCFSISPYFDTLDPLSSAMNANGSLVVGRDLFSNSPEGVFADLFPVTPPAAAADVDVSKVAEFSQINAGSENAGYAIRVFNEGSATATGVTLSDPLPAGPGIDITWQIDTTTGDPADFVISGPVGAQVLTLAPGVTTLTAGQALVVHIVGTTTFVDAPGPTFRGTITNTATVNATNEPASDQNDHSAATITMVAPDVDISKKADSSTITAGATAGYTITVFNEGAGTATNIDMYDILSAGVGNDITWHIDPAFGNASAFNITGTLGSQVLKLVTTTLAPGAILKVHILGATTAADVGVLPNTADVFVSGEATAEQFESSSAQIIVRPIVVPPPLPPDVIVSKTADNPFITPGDTAGYTIQLENVGSSPATGVTLSDPLPAGAGNDIDWQIDPSTGTPSDFVLSGPVGKQMLTLAPGLGPLTPFRTLSVHITGVTSLADAPNVFQSGDFTIRTGLLQNTATASAANEPAALQNAKATATIDLLEQTQSTPSPTPASPSPAKISPPPQLSSLAPSSRSSSSADATLSRLLVTVRGPVLSTAPFALFTPLAGPAAPIPQPAAPPVPPPAVTYPPVLEGALSSESGNAPAGIITGAVFFDRNGNGVREAGESGIAGLTVFLEMRGDGQYHPGDPYTVTNDRGEYVFRGLPLNHSYQVRQLTPQFMAQTFPQRDAGHIVLLSDEHPAETGVVFGTVPFRPATPPIRPAATTGPDSAATVKPAGGSRSPEESQEETLLPQASDAAFGAGVFWRGGVLPVALLGAVALGRERRRRSAPALRAGNRLR